MPTSGRVCRGDARVLWQTQMMRGSTFVGGGICQVCCKPAWMTGMLGLQEHVTCTCLHPRVHLMPLISLHRLLMVGIQQADQTVVRGACHKRQLFSAYVPLLMT